MKRKIFSLIALLSACLGLYSQKAYLADDFLEGKRLYFVQKTEDNVIKEYYLLSDIFSGEVVLEYGDKSISTPQIQDMARTIAFENIKDINIRLSDDMNFDGREDIIIDDPELDDMGCYMPMKNSNVFISHGDKYVYSNDISSLYNDSYCMPEGYLDVDDDSRRLIKIIIGRAGMNDYEVYEVDGIHIKMVEHYIEDVFSNPVFMERAGKKLVNGEWKDVDLKAVFEDDLDKILSFKTQNGKGEVMLFVNDTILYYTFKQPDGYISFAYPSHPDKLSKSKFKIENVPDGIVLEFYSGSIKYTVYETDNIGIKIDVDGKVTDWKGVYSTKIGGFQRLLNENLKNVIK